MKLQRTAALTAVTAILFAAPASAVIITYNTNGAGTGFSGGTSLSLGSSSGAASATLVFEPNGNTVTGVPSNVNFGNFTLACPACTTQALGTGATFNPFSIDLVITDVTDGGATGTFVGTSTGGAVYSDVSQLTVNWSPLVIGPGTTNASSGNFGSTTFSTTSFTGIVAPNSGGASAGVSTVQGFVTSSSAVPEPATYGMVGLALVGLGFLRRKAVTRS